MPFMQKLNAINADLSAPALSNAINASAINAIHALPRCLQ